MATEFEKIGEATLRAVVVDFVGRVMADDMIGFFFAAVDPDRLAELEFQFAARALGGQVRYTGRPIAEAHAAHRIMGGQFARRMTLLGETLRDHGVEPSVQAAWLDHGERLRPLITNQPGSACDQGESTGPLVVQWRPGGESEEGT